MKKNPLAILIILLSFYGAEAQWSALSDINNLVSSTSYDQMNPKIINDGAGGYIVAWTEKNPSDFNVWAQRLSATGAPLWGANGVAVCNTTDHQILGGLISDGASGAIIVWEDSAGTGGGGSHGMNDIYAQRISSTGTKMWATAGVSICSASDIQSNVNIISDNSNGAIIVWHDYRNNGYLGSDIYAQRINVSGSVQWPTNGVIVSSATNPQVRPRICADGSGGAYIAWEDYRLYSQSEIYFQRLDASGTALFTADGVIACTAANDQIFPEIIQDGVGGAFLSWYDKRTNGNLGVGDLFGQRINSSGSIQWGSSGLSLCNASGDQFASFSNLPCMTSDESGGFYYVWNDLRNGSHNVYIQRFNSSGTGLWTANGVAVNNSSFNELYPSVVPDGTGGVYVTWDRYGNGSIDIYAQRMDGNGNALWVANGIPVGNAMNSQYNNQLVTKGDGSAIVVFNDKRNNVDFNIYAQRIISGGTCIPPTVLATATTTNLCMGSSVTISVSGPDSYFWTNLGSGSSKVVSPSSSTAYTVTATASDGCTNTSTILINVLNLPVVGATTSALTICPGTSITLTGNGASTYVWSNNVSATTQTLVPTASTTYTVTGTSSNGCTATSTIGIMVNTPPVITTTPTVSTVCFGGTATITANGASSYVWSTGATTAALTAGPTTTTTYTVTGTGSNGCTSTATKTMNVNNLPNIVVTPTNAAVCIGSSITLTATGAGSYTWTGMGTGATKTVTPSTTTVYTITGTSGTGCSNSTTKTVTVNPIPSITITPPAISVCSGEFISLLAGGGNAYVWANNSSTNLTQTISPTITTTYTVTGTAGTGCSATATATVSVNSIPAVSISPSSVTICSGSSTILTASATSSTFQWTNLGNSTTQTVSPSGTTTYTVTATNALGCTATATRTVTVFSTPSMVITPPAPAICAGSTISLTASNASTYIWTSLGSNAVQSVTPSGTTTYTVTGTGSSGCTATATATVTINQNPLTAISPTNLTICQGSTATLTASGALTYSWNNLGTNAVQMVSPTTTTIYTVTGTNASGCTSSTTRIVNVTTASTVNIIPTNPSICLGSSVTLTPTGASSYVWNGLPSGSVQTVSPSVTTTYTVTGTFSNGCTSSASVSVTLKSLPSVNISASNNPICSGSPTTLTATGASTYLWSNTITAASQIVSPTTTTIYTVTGTSSNGCTANSSVTIAVSGTCNAVLTTKCLVEGYYVGNGLMTPALFNEGQSSDPLACDSITISLHSTSSPYNTLYSQKVPMTLSGNASWPLPTAVQNNSYYITIQFRNALQLWSANPVSVTGNLTYNFTNAANKAFGDNQILVDPILNLYATYSGDINQDETIDTFDYLLLDPDVFSGNGGYLVTDVNGDGAIDSFDYLLLAPHIFDGIGAAGP